jgi:signal transduction histidine kinase
VSHFKRLLVVSHTEREGRVRIIRKDPSCVEISVRDNGVGMSEEVQRQIFEPFFTTKQASKGVGLGLAVVSGIVSQHSGSVRVKSTVGAGTVFELLLPLPSRLSSAKAPARNSAEAGA